MTNRTKLPVGLGKSGRALWRKLTENIGYELQELAYLEAACRLEDRAVELDALVEAEGLMVHGSKGQPVLHPAVAEARQARAEQARLLARVDWPTDAGRASTAGRRLRSARRVG